jgi:hypothetical protein
MREGEEGRKKTVGLVRFHGISEFDAKFVTYFGRAFRTWLSVMSYVSLVSMIHTHTPFHTLSPLCFAFWDNVSSQTHRELFFREEILDILFVFGVRFLGESDLK